MTDAIKVRLFFQLQGCSLDELTQLVRTDLIREGVGTLEASKVHNEHVALAMVEILTEGVSPVTRTEWVEAISPIIYRRISEAAIRDEVDLCRGVDVYEDGREDVVNGLGIGVERVMWFARRRYEELRTCGNEIDAASFLVNLHERVARQTAVAMARRGGRSFKDARTAADAAHRLLKDELWYQR